MPDYVIAAYAITGLFLLVTILLFVFVGVSSGVVAGLFTAYVFVAMVRHWNKWH